MPRNWNDDFEDYRSIYNNRDDVRSDQRNEQRDDFRDYNPNRDSNRRPVRAYQYDERAGYTDRMGSAGPRVNERNLSREDDRNYGYERGDMAHTGDFDPSDRYPTHNYRQAQHPNSFGARNYTSDDYTRSRFGRGDVGNTGYGMSGSRQSWGPASFGGGTSGGSEYRGTLGYGNTSGRFASTSSGYGSYDDQNYGDQNYGDQNYGTMGRDSNFSDVNRADFSGRGPKNWRRSDDRIREDICETLERNPRVDASEIEVDVKDGIVTLRGAVDNRRTKRYAEECIETCSGVKDVRNELSVDQSFWERAKQAILGDKSQTTTTSKH
jgi:osmotically-inducible protein OsmY